MPIPGGSGTTNTGGSASAGSSSDASNSTTAAAGATAPSPDITPPGGWLAYTGVWVLPIFIAGLLFVGGGIGLLLVARRRRRVHGGMQG